MIPPTSPNLFVVSRPSFDRQNFSSFLKQNELSWADTDSATDAERIVEISGRLCYLSFTDDTSKIRHPTKTYIENLINKGHESVLEHANWTFFLTDVSRAFTHQLVRHRVGFSYSQLSQQYHDETDADFVIPAGLSSEAHEHWKCAVQASKDAYREVLKQAERSLTAVNDQSTKEDVRLMRSAARSLLPNATSTAISVSANARALRHFLDLRGSIVGDIEMRLVSSEIYDMLVIEAPSFVEDFEKRNCENGWPLVKKISS